ncbi:MAG: GNAT family N-acetyltransferase, partial [Thermoanaerobaculia bacterium]|nr:GNAT family N-acetyltransferase [Thermoanaerobaculia bacterium]
MGPHRQRSTVEAWGQNVDYAKVFPLLAFDGSRIVADATLHRREHGPLRLVGRVKWLLDSEFRGAGLGTLLINHFISTARDQGLRHLTCMLISDLEADAVRTVTELGFIATIIAGYGSDPVGAQHEMTKLVLMLFGASLFVGVC